MKKFIALANLVLVAIVFTGCKTVTAPLPAWAPNDQAATVGSIISAANADVVGYEKDQVDGATTPILAKCPGVKNAALHTAVQDIQKSLVIAQPEFDAWLSALKTNPGATEPANLAAIISTIQSTLTQWPALAK